MTDELTALTLAALLQVAQFGLMAVPANRELGPARTMGPRDGDDLRAGLSPRTARLHRALSNHFEGLILFGIAVTVITLSDQSTAVTRWAAWIYLAARVLYVPCYAMGLVPWRSVIWAVGFAATVAILLSALI